MLVRLLCVSRLLLIVVADSIQLSYVLAVLDAVSSQITLGRKLFEVGVERGFYAKVSRLGEQWFELDLHFLSLGGGEIALGWWFEECLVPYLTNTERLATVKSISIVTGYGKTRTRGRRHGDDGMRKRCRAMLRFMGITEHEQSNLGRIHVNKESLIEEVNKNGGRIIFDLEGYIRWKETETTANVTPDTEQKIRARFQPTNPGSGRPPFTRVESEYTTEEYRLENQVVRLAKLRELDALDNSEYRSDIDYAVRDNIRFDESSDRNDRGRNNDRSQGGFNNIGPGRDEPNRQMNNRDERVGRSGMDDRERRFMERKDERSDRNGHSISNNINRSNHDDSRFHRDGRSGNHSQGGSMDRQGNWGSDNHNQRDASRFGNSSDRNSGGRSNGFDNNNRDHHSNQRDSHHFANNNRNSNDRRGDDSFSAADVGSSSGRDYRNKGYTDQRSARFQQPNDGGGVPPRDYRSRDDGEGGGSRRFQNNNVSNNSSAFDNNNQGDRKRPFYSDNDSGGNNNGYDNSTNDNINNNNDGRDATLERRSSNSSSNRGYSLEQPQPQRRRLS